MVKLARPKRRKHLAEAALLRFLATILRFLPLDLASFIGGGLGTLTGYLVSNTRTARRNLAMAMPELSAAEREKIIRRMWNHLGRSAAEFVHLSNPRMQERVHVEGLENLPLPGTPILFFSGHLGNWELLPYVAHYQGYTPALIYREANNPLAERLIQRIRRTYTAEFISKERKSAGRIVAAAKQGIPLAMLVDQKLTGGVEVPFFGQPAKTAPMPAQLALKYGLALIPVRIARTRGAHFRCTVLPPLALPMTENEKDDVYRTLCAMNAQLEQWIRETPEQWFWVHRRWPKK